MKKLILMLLMVVCCLMTANAQKTVVATMIAKKFLIENGKIIKNSN